MPITNQPIIIIILDSHYTTTTTSSTTTPRSRRNGGDSSSSSNRNRITHYQPRLRNTMTMKTGPNDVSRVVWAISKFFFLLLSCFFAYQLMIYIEFRIYLLTQRRVREGGDDEIGSKRHVSRRLGPRCVFFYLCVFNTN